MTMYTKRLALSSYLRALVLVLVGVPDESKGRSLLCENEIVGGNSCGTDRGIYPDPNADLK